MTAFTPKPYAMRANISLRFMKTGLVEFEIFEQGMEIFFELSFQMKDGLILESETAEERDTEIWKAWSKYMSQEEKDKFFLDAATTIAVQMIDYRLTYDRQLPEAGYRLMLGWIKEMEDKRHGDSEIAEAMGLTAEGLRKFKSGRKGLGCNCIESFIDFAKPSLDYEDLIAGYEPLEGLPEPAASIVRRTYGETARCFHDWNSPVVFDHSDEFIRAARRVISACPDKLETVAAVNEQLSNIGYAEFQRHNQYTR